MGVSKHLCHKDTWRGFQEATSKKLPSPVPKRQQNQQRKQGQREKEEEEEQQQQEEQGEQQHIKNKHIILLVGLEGKSRYKFPSK